MNNNNTNFTIIMDILNRKIADTNIKIITNDESEEKESFKSELSDLLNDREALYSCNLNDFTKILKKYGVTLDE